MIVEDHIPGQDAPRFALLAWLDLLSHDFLRLGDLVTRVRVTSLVFAMLALFAMIPVVGATDTTSPTWHQIGMRNG